MLSCGALMGFLPTLTWLRFVVWLVLGLIVYFVYSMHHSHLARNGK
jgi:APA family basic amino acid/polyamine antiporter